VCCLDEEGAWASELKQRGVAVSALHRTPGFHPALGLKIAALADRHQASAVHCHHYSPFVYGRLAMMRRRGLGMVFTEHGRLHDGAPSLKRRVINAGAAWLPGFYCAVSEDLRAHMIAEGFPASRVRVVHNGINSGRAITATERAAVRNALGVPLHAYVVGTIARLDPVKDLPTLIAAFDRMHPSVPNAQLVIVGDGSERIPLEQLVRARGLGDCVRLLGARANARHLLPAFDVYVNTSITEGISVTILEAMAAALPVVATRVGGTTEVVTPDAGVLVDARDPASVARGLLAVARMPDRGRLMAECGRSRVQTTFSAARMTATYVDLYRRCGHSRRQTFVSGGSDFSQLLQHPE
jgi:glycosyltransferase involved in cell wall biosynthesis